MNYNAQKEQISTAGILPLLEPVPIFIREEAGGRSFGGDAVYTARVMLNIDPMDIGVDYTKPPQNKPQIAKENPVRVFPNPATNQINIQFTDIINNDAVIEIYGSMGNQVLSECMLAGNYIKFVDVSKLNAGLYYYSILLNGNKVSSGKLTIIKK